MSFLDLQNKLDGQTILSERSELPSLDNYYHISPRDPWSRRRRRFFQRAMSGITYARALGQSMRFMTLTSSPLSPETITRSFDTLRKRIRREFGTFEYIWVREFTKAGRPHLHVLFRGSYIPQAWLSRAWGEIHGAPITWIESVRGDRRQVTNYLAKYLSKEDAGRFAWSRNWVYAGFVRDWKNVLCRNVKGGVLNLNLAISDWEKHLIDHALRSTQTRIDGG